MKVTHEDFRTIRLMASLFTPDEEVSSKKLLATLPENWKAKFTGQPMQVIVEGQFAASPEIPKLILKDNAGVWICEIGSSRVNFIWQNSAVDALVPLNTEFFSEASTFLNEYAYEIQRARVGRISTAIERYLFMENPAAYLCEYFCKESLREEAGNGPLKRSDNFEIHNHKRFSFEIVGERINVNSWVRSKTEKLPVENDLRRPIILVIQDINSLKEELEYRNFSHEQISGFFKASSFELDKILSLYYPKSE